MTSTSPAPKSLLIVEDDEGLRRQYRWVFPGLRLILAGTREEAVASIRREQIPEIGRAHV